MNSYNTKSFKKLKQNWYKQLKDSGFKDLESHKGNLYQPNLRTIRWRNQDLVKDFFFTLDNFLEHDARISHREWLVLQNWTKGVYLIDISRKTHIPIITVNRIVKKYRIFVIELMKNSCK